MKYAAWLMVVVVAAVVLPAGEARADFGLVRQCESPTATSWWSTALYEDDRDELFRQENFPDTGVWPAEGDVGFSLAPGIRECFGAGTPHSRKVLLHWVLARPEGEYDYVQPHPVLLVPGAGDNGKRVFTFMAYALAFEGYNVFTVTFAHPNGDNYQHAEQLANVIEVISGLYDGAAVDVVAHSMGGAAARVYASNDGAVDWGRADPRGAAYDNSGTRYRGDIRRLVFLGSPLAGADTSFRWPNSNYTRVLEQPVNAPVSWDTYYPLTTANVFVTEDYTSYGYFAEQDYFPGQAQVVARLDDRVPLPGTIPELGWMALQQDWFTTYEGGLGFYSDSRGVDAAIERGGGMIAKLQGGVDPEIELFVAAGRNPIMPLEYGALFLSEDERATYGSSMEADWARLKAQWLDPQMPWNGVWEGDVEKLFEGRSVMAEVSGPSDGIILYESATDIDGLTVRGAEVTEVRTFDALNHLELTFTGRLSAFFFGDEASSGELYDPVASAKYDEPENQVVEWVESVLFTVVEQPGEDVGVDADAGSEDASDAMDPDGGEDADAAGDGGGDAAGDVEGGDAVAPDVPEEDTGGEAFEDVPSSGDGVGGVDAADQGSANASPRDRSGCAVAPGERGGAPLGLWVVLGVVLAVMRR